LSRAWRFDGTLLYFFIHFFDSFAPVMATGRIGYGYGLILGFFDAKGFQRLPQRSLSMEGHSPIFIEFFPFSSKWQRMLSSSFVVQPCSFVTVTVF